MGYLHIDNLYKNQEILMFKKCYAMEKIHGTSANVSFKDSKLNFFSGGEKLEKFVKLFNQEELLLKFKENFPDYQAEVVVFGEAYGGSCQKMSETYGPSLKFVAFDVKIGYTWLDVRKAESVVKNLGLEFVHYWESSTDLEELNQWRDADSVQAIRNGVGPGKKMEGVVLRPLLELTKNNGARIIAKHKRDEFRETKTPRKVSEEDLAVLVEAQSIADEWVTEMRITHVLDKIDGGPSLDKMKIMIDAVAEDIKREAEGEIVWGKTTEKTIKNKAAQIIRKQLTTIKES